MQSVQDWSGVNFGKTQELEEQMEQNSMEEALQNTKCSGFSSPSSEIRGKGEVSSLCPALSGLSQAATADFYPPV